MRRKYSPAFLAGVCAIASGTLAPALSQPARAPDTASAGSQAEDPAPRVQTFEEALTQDAADYARQIGVSLDEAKRRLIAGRDTVPATDRLRATYGSRLAGISIEHKPEYRIVVLLTGDAPVAAETVAAGGLSVPIVFRTGAKSTHEQLLAALNQHDKAIRTLLPATQGIGIDPRTGELVVVVNAPGVAAAAAFAREAELETLTGVPVRVRAIDGVDVDSDVRGGSRYEGNNTSGVRYYCTTGFVVKNTSGTTAMATAAHCEDGNPKYYNPNMTEIPLTLVGSWGYGTQDVQINTSAYVERAEFYVDTNKTYVRRPVGQYARTATRAGDSACHRGETTGASCSFVELINYQPPPDKCGGYCNATWITVTGPHCSGGDSGGPVYDLDLARGLLKGSSKSSTGTCNYYFYMSLDYLPSGWSLLLG
jgi:streptogrisin C